MADKLGCDEKEKSLYLVQIWYLEEQLERCLLRCDELEKEHQDLRSQYSILEKDKKSVTGKLKCTVAAKQKKAEELAEELEKQQHQTELEREALKLQHRQEVEEVEEQRIQMESDIKTQAVNMEEQKEQLAHVQHTCLLSCHFRSSCSGGRDAAEDSGRLAADRDVQHPPGGEGSAQGEAGVAPVPAGEQGALEREKKILQDAEGEVSVRLEEVGKQLHEVKKERSVHRKEVKTLKERRRQMMEEMEHWDLSVVLQHINSLISAEAAQLEAELRRERSRRLQLDGVRQEAAVVLRHILTRDAEVQRRSGCWRSWRVRPPREEEEQLRSESPDPQDAGADSCSCSECVHRRTRSHRTRSTGRNTDAASFQNKSLSIFNQDSQQYSPEFGQLSLVRKVPVMKDGGFVLTESTAILKYMAQKHSSSVADHWFPAELQQRARVNEYLSWQHMNLRTNGSKVFLLRTLFPIIMDSEAPQEKEDSAVEDLKQSLDLLEQMFLQNKPFIVGDKISLADLVAIVEIMQPVSAGMDAFEGRPKLAAWRARVKKELGEKLFDEAHEAIMNRSALLQKMQNNPQLHLLKPKFQKLFNAADSDPAEPQVSRCCHLQDGGRRRRRKPVDCSDDDDDDDDEQLQESGHVTRAHRKKKSEGVSQRFLLLRDTSPPPPLPPPHPGPGPDRTSSGTSTMPCCSLLSLCQYDTNKLVRIQSVRLGSLKWSLNATILLFICIMMLWNKKYQEFDLVVSSVTTKVKGVAQDKNSFFVVTNVIVTKQQRQGKCPEAPHSGSLCRTNSDCKKGAWNQQSHDRIMCEIRRVEENLRGLGLVSNREQDRAPRPALLEAAENFTVLIKNNIRFPAFNFFRRNILPNMDASYLRSCHRANDSLCPIFRLGDLVREAGEKFSQMAIEGGVIGILIKWDCDLDRLTQRCLPRYSFRRLDEKESNRTLYPGLNFRFAKYDTVNGVEERTLYKAFGIRFDVMVFGQTTILLDWLIGTSCYSAEVGQNYSERKVEAVRDEHKRLLCVSYVDEKKIRLVKSSRKKRLQDMKPMSTQPCKEDTGHLRSVLYLLLPSADVDQGADRNKPDPKPRPLGRTGAIGATPPLLEAVLLYRDPLTPPAERSDSSTLRHCAYTQYVSWRFGAPPTDAQPAIPGAACRESGRSTRARTDSTVQRRALTEMCDSPAPWSLVDLEEEEEEEEEEDTDQLGRTAQPKSFSAV
ncbi:hypothetical protein INR49_020893 [Caranx melampygus]|nr:hypothetical protein INR49_020893 [Caranx melampygus]